MKKWMLIVVLSALVFSGVSVGAAQGSGGFSVSPPSLKVTVAEDDQSPVIVYITSSFDGELNVGTEGIPFRVGPDTITVSRGDNNRKWELTVYDEPSVKEGEYSGKLTFLTYTGQNVAYGIKINISVTKTRESGRVAEFFNWFGDNGTLGKVIGKTGRNYIIIIVAAVIIIALVGGIFIGRKTRKH